MLYGPDGKTLSSNEPNHKGRESEIKVEKLQRAHGLTGDPEHKSETEQGRGRERQKPAQGGSDCGNTSRATSLCLDTEFLGNTTCDSWQTGTERGGMWE
jgi:hypothetical protein